MRCRPVSTRRRVICSAAARLSIAMYEVFGASDGWPTKHAGSPISSMARVTGRRPGGEHDRAVHEPAAEVLDHALVVPAGVDHDRHELLVRLGQDRVRADQDVADVRVVEHLDARLVHDERDGAGAAGDEAAAAALRT